MAQNISILEGGTAQQFGQVNKLKIANSGGGTSLWVPEDEVDTKSLNVNSNGTYYASQDECYGYDEVSVNITNECFGYDDDGNLWDVEVDDDDFLEEEEMPVRIEVTTPPTKTSYIAYEPINTAGMVVTAYYADGTEYGAIPREEYTIDPLVADPTKASAGFADSDLISDYYYYLKKPIPMGVPTGHDGNTTLTFEYEGEAITGYHGTNGITSTIGFGGLVASKTYNGGWVRYVEKDESGIHKGYKSYTDSEFTYNGKTAYYAGSGIQGAIWTSLDIDAYKSEYKVETRGDAFGRIAWTMLYGTITDKGKLEVKVEWTREDGEVLETSFDVNVSDIPVPPVSGDDSGGGGSSGGSW